jgi:hypothetical protein
VRVVYVTDRRGDSPVAEPGYEFRTDGHTPGKSLNDPNDLRRAGAWGHEVDDTTYAIGGVPLGFQDQRAVAIPASRRSARLGGNQPASVLPIAEQTGKARVGVEARQAAPVDRTAAVDERSGLQPRDEGVVLDPSDHVISEIRHHQALGRVEDVVSQLVSFASTRARPGPSGGRSAGLTATRPAR